MSSYSLTSWWRGDRRILYLFALYGLAASTIMYTCSVLYNQDFAIIGFLLNIPAFFIMMWVDGTIASPSGYSIFFDPVVMIPYRVIAWSFIGLIGYLFIKMFKMGP